MPKFKALVEFEINLDVDRHADRTAKAHLQWQIDRAIDGNDQEDQCDHIKIVTIYELVEIKQ